MSERSPWRKAVMFRMCLLAVGCFFLSPRPAASQSFPERLQCTVDVAKRVNSQGSLDDVDYGSPGLTFVVDRSDGRMDGLPRNHNPYGTPRVIEHGSSEMDFKAVTIYEPFAAAEVLVIRIWEPKMPFAFSSGLDFFSGTCVPAPSRENSRPPNGQISEQAL